MLGRTAAFPILGVQGRSFALPFCTIAHVTKRVARAKKGPLRLLSSSRCRAFMVDERCPQEQRPKDRRHDISPRHGSPDPLDPYRRIGRLVPRIPGGRILVRPAAGSRLALVAFYIIFQ